MKAKRRTKKTNIRGTSDRPRMSVFKSGTNIYVQIINDEEGKTLVFANSLKLERKKKAELAKDVGREAAKKALKSKINTVLFDRGNRKYHGCIAAVAEGAREEGLKI